MHIVALSATLAASSVNGVEQGKQLFILSGQSNMAKLDPGISFTPAVEKEFGKSNVIVVWDALGGQPIRRWYKKWKPANGNEPKRNGDLYDGLMAKVNAAISATKIQTVTFIWMQGERDAKEMQGEVYADSLKGLIEQLRSDLKRTDINVVVGRINDANNDEQWNMVRKALVEVAESLPHGGWVDTDDLNGPDNQNGVHATKEGYVILGERFAEKAIALIKTGTGRAMDGGKK